MLSEEPLFEDVELFEENPELTLMLSKLARDAVKWIKNNVVQPIVEVRDKLRRVFNIGRIDSSEDMYVAVLAVDSTWSRPPLELVSGVLAIIVAGYIITTPQHPGWYGIGYAALGRSAGEDDVRFGIKIELKSKILEFATATKALRHYALIDLALIDGPLFPGIMFEEFYKPRKSVDPVRESRRSSQGFALASYTASALLKLLDLANELEKPVVGVVKRVSSKFMIPILKEKGFENLIPAITKSNDKTLFSYILEPGEYVVVGTVYDLIAKWFEHRKKRMLKVLEKACSGDLGEESRKLCEYMKNTAVVYYMPRTDLVFPQAVRLDIYPKDRALDVVRYAINDTSHNAVPTPIDLVDRFVRIESNVIRRFHELLQAYSENFDVMVAIGFTNPQKAYLYRYTSSRTSSRWS